MSFMISVAFIYPLILNSSDTKQTLPKNVWTRRYIISIFNVVDDVILFSISVLCLAYVLDTTYLTSLNTDIFSTTGMICTLSIRSVYETCKYLLLIFHIWLQSLIQLSLSLFAAAFGPSRTLYLWFVRKWRGFFSIKIVNYL